MKIKLIGLGKMGMNIAQNMLDHELDVTGYARSQKTRDAARALNIPVADSYGELLKRNDENYVVWLLVPNNVVDQVLLEIRPLLKKGDIIVDGGNSNFNLSIMRHATLKDHGLDFIDLGTSGGTHGARNGACLMAGGEIEVIKKLEPVFLKIATKDGYAHVGKPGAGHFVKMVHNGIEYGMMQAIGEGFAFLEKSDFELDYYQIANVWNHGSIIESLLIKNIRDAFSKSPELSELAGVVDDSGEGMWMIEEALSSKVALPVITAALFARYKSKDETKFGEKVVAAIRNEFGGHKVYKKDEK
ncbi:MAG TPA: decarboxylating 6-phosphogluconate dehydrogenase [Bacilli bacterium]|nr:decarboxylating 6-phosphogluconate dehydrogenase [Bacilli bacterium]